MKPNNKYSYSLMSWTKLGRKNFKEPSSFKSREQNGMTSISKRKKNQQGDWALLYDNRFNNFKGKLTTHWMGPYEIDTIYDNVSIRIKTIDEHQTPLLVNGHRFRIYNKPLSKEDFLTHILHNSNMQVISKEGYLPTDPH
jgi:hypothetical protein